MSIILGGSMWFLFFFACFSFFHMGGKYFRSVVGQGFLGFYLVWGFDIASLVDTRPLRFFFYFLL